MRVWWRTLRQAEAGMNEEDQLQIQTPDNIFSTTHHLELEREPTSHRVVDEQVMAG